MFEVLLTAIAVVAAAIGSVVGFGIGSRSRPCWHGESRRKSRWPP